MVDVEGGLLVEERLGELIVDSGVVLIVDRWRGTRRIEIGLKFKSGEQRGEMCI